jgi:hypothetical protein
MPFYWHLRFDSELVLGWNSPLTPGSTELAEVRPLSHCDV